MIKWAKAVVTGCRHVHDGLQEVDVRFSGGETGVALHYPDKSLPILHPGNVVLLNTTAVSLGLGTGGYHFVAAVLADGDEAMDGATVNDAAVATAESALSDDCAGHMMKLRYTPWQRAVLAAEEVQSPYHNLFGKDAQLDGMPVLIGELHSMLPICACWLRYAAQSASVGNADAGDKPARPLRVAYIMTDGGALPYALSRHAAILRGNDCLCASITYGHAYGGDLETINKYTALITAKHAARADIAIAAMGPGIAGTGTAFGHSGVEVGELINAVSILGGVPIVIPRISFADSRERHVGLSHHMLNTLGAIALRGAVIPLPDTLEADKKQFILQQIRAAGLDRQHQTVWMKRPALVEISQALADYPLRVTTMGKDLSADPDFFSGVGAAAEYARSLCIVAHGAENCKE